MLSGPLKGAKLCQMPLGSIAVIAIIVWIRPCVFGVCGVLVWSGMSQDFHDSFKMVFEGPLPRFSLGQPVVCGKGRYPWILWPAARLEANISSRVRSLMLQLILHDWVNSVELDTPP